MLMVKGKGWMSLRVSRSLEIIDSFVVLDLAGIVFVEERFLFFDFLLGLSGKSLFFLLCDQILEFELMQF